jgi:large conductance mechanosensitive channel
VGVASEFKDFISKGSAIDTAVGLIIGLAFSAIVTALVADLISPLIGLPGKVDLGSLSFAVGAAVFLYGAFLNAVIYFVIIAAVVFFVLVRPVAKMRARAEARKPKAPATTRECPECLSQVPLAARRCAFCTSSLAPLPASA